MILQEQGGIAESRIRTRNGHKALVMLIPFSGDGENGRHYFNNHNHAVNFVKYLFSQSQAHPATSATHMNYHREIGDDGKLARWGHVTDPKEMLKSFLGRRMPKKDAHLSLCDDGCYPIFAIKMKGRPFVSNFLSRGADDVATLSHPYAQAMEEMSGSDGEFLTDPGRFAFLEDMVGDEFPTSLEAEPAMAAWSPKEDFFLQAVISHTMGKSEDVMMTVSHRDQTRHNTFYHVHRLLKLR